MKILIAGANGYTGRILVQKLSQHPVHEPWAMIREESQEIKMEELGVSGSVVADLEKDLDHTVKGMDGVIFAAGSGSKTGPDKTIDVDQEGAKRLTDACVKSGVDHFVMLSARGVDNPSGKIAHYREAKRIADEYLMKSGLIYTIVRPGRLNFEQGTGKIELKRVIENHEGRSISREDVADVLIKSFDIAEVKNKVFEILSGKTPIDKAMISHNL